MIIQSLHYKTYENLKLFYNYNQHNITVYNCCICGITGQTPPDAGSNTHLPVSVLHLAPLPHVSIPRLESTTHLVQ